jgi:hypothetical protein
MPGTVRFRFSPLVYLLLGLAGLDPVSVPAAGEERPQQAKFKDQFLKLCDESCPILRQQARAAEKGKRVFYMDSYVVRALMTAHDMTGKQDYFDASKLWCDRMLEYQRGMIPAGAYYMQYGRKPGEDKGDWYSADSSSIGLGVLAVSVRATDLGQKQRYLDSVKAFFKLVADRFVRPSGGVTDGYWPKSNDEWWCSTGIFGSLAFHLYAETRDEIYLRTGLGTIDWLNRQDLLGMKDYAMPIVLMYSLEAYSASLPYLQADTPRRTAALDQLARIHQWILKNRGGHSGIEYASWAGSKSAGLPFHLYVFARFVPDHEKLVNAADEELRYIGDLLEKNPLAKNRGHLAAFALVSYAEKLCPGSIDRPSKRQR